MAAALTQTLINKDFKSWLKGALAVLFAKEGLSDFVEHEIIDFQRHLLQTIYAQKGIPPGTTCSSCTTANVLACPTVGFCSKGKKCKAHDSKLPDKKPNQVCPNGLCLHIRDAIKNEHLFKGPSWKNTDARRWCSDAYEVSKCFMPPDGYSDKTCLADTDFNGILAIVINNKRFQKQISVNLGLVPNIFTEARIIGREIRHSANHLLSDQDLKKYIDDLITLLSDPVYLAADVKANDAVGKLKQLKTNTLTIHADDITNVLNESIKTTFSEQQNAFLRDIHEHFKNHKNDSVEAFDRKIQESGNKQLAELNAQTKRGKDELNAEKEKGITELNLQSKTNKDKLQSYIEQGKYVLNINTKKGKDELKTQLEQGTDVLNTYTIKGKDELQKQLEQGTEVLNTYTNKSKNELQTQLEQGTDVLKTYTNKSKDELKTQLEQGTDVLNTHTNKGKDQLQKQLEQGTEVLNTYTKKGKDGLQAQLEQGTDVLKTYTKKGKDELQAQLKQEKDVLNTHITATNIALNAQTKTINELDKSIVLYTRTVDNVIHKGIQELQEVTKKGKQELEVQRKLSSEQFNRSADCATTKKTQNPFWDKITFKELRLRSKFKKELVRLYNEKESMIPASPLVEDYAVPLTELYVQPPMSAFNKPNAFGQGNKHSEKTPVRSYRELFLNKDNIPYKNIYVEANAGYGKTSFTQKVAMTWCQAHRPNKVTKGNFKQDDVLTLKRFKFLFLLHLRDFQGDTCNLDELILKSVPQNLPNKEQFSEEFIAKILQTKTCLVIIDGLDEWVHPETCTRTPGIPHNNYRGNCTVLTTTRPWKLSSIGLPPNLIDRHLEISHLDDKTSNELKSNAVKILNENSGEKKRELADFNRKASSEKLGDIHLIPYILLQLICIWFDGLSIGNSKCETYSNTIELTLQRGLNKKNAPTLSTGNAERNITVPECMRHNVLCNQYMNLLFKLGKLAFYALFQKIKESRLVIDITPVLEFVTEQELEFCLKIGLLSQNKDRSKVSVKRYKVFFQHKSIQEFMAALYIVSEWNNVTIKSTIFEVCSSLSSILEMANLFVFVCGMNPEIYTCISGELQKTVDLDNVTCTYRTYMSIVDDSPDYNNALKSMKSYQSMQLECLQESLRNGNDSCPIPFYFGLDKHSLTYDVKTLKSIMQINEHIGESPEVSLYEKIVASMLCDNSPFVFMQSLDPGVFTSLETLRVEDCDKEPVWLADILTESARTLKCLTLSCIFLSDISIRALTGLTCLQQLCLLFVNTTHSNLKYLYTHISHTTTLTQLKLGSIFCSEHEYRDCDVTLDLHRLNELKMLHLFVVPCRELHVNPACLEKLDVRPPWGEKMTARASASLWQDLREAPVLSSLTLSDMTSCQEMIQTIPTLTQLQYLQLVDINMGYVIPRLSPDMTKLEHVELSSVTMSSAAWQELFFSIARLQNPVTVELSSCQGPSMEKWLTIVNAFKTTPTLSLLQDLSFPWDGFSGVDLASLTLIKQ